MSLSLAQKNLLWLVPSLKTTPFSAHHSGLDLTYEHATDPLDINEYFSIRSECYKNDLGIDSVASTADQFDVVANIFIVRKFGKIVGGARTITCKPGSSQLLPLEAEGFSLREALPSLQLEKATYSEISRLAIHPDFRNIETTEYLIRFMFAFLECEDSNFLFTNAPMIQARAYRKMICGFGYNYKILDEVKMPVQKVYNSLKNVVLSVAPLDRSLHIVQASSNNWGDGSYPPQIEKAA